MNNEKISDEKIENIVDRAFDFVGERLRESPWMRRILRESLAWQRSMTRLERKKNKNDAEEEIYDSLGLDFDAADDAEMNDEIDEILGALKGKF